MYRFHNVDIRDQHLTWHDKSQVYYVGPHSVFRDSHIDIARSARGLVIIRTRFIGCTIRFRRQLTNFSFCRNYFESCQLLGRFVGCDFGHRIDDQNSPAYFPQAGIVDTDLSQATLHGCQFLDCDMATITLPRWPHFTIMNPSEVYQDALSLPWPGETQVMMRICKDNPPGTKAITWHARQTCKQDGGTEEELRAVLEQIPGVIM